MKFLFLVAKLVLVQILFLTTSPSLASTEVNLPPDYNIEIIKGNNGTGLHVTYLFKSPVTEFVMPGRGEKPLEVRIFPNSGGFIIDGNNVRHLSGEEFSAVSFTLEPDIRKIDRAYPTLFKTSRDALVLFPENLIVNDVLPDKITISAASGESIYLGGSTQKKLVLRPKKWDDLRQFLMIGTWKSYHVGMLEVIGAEQLPENSSAILRETITTLATTLEMQDTSTEKGTIAIFIENAARGDNQLMGDVAADGAMHLTIPLDAHNSVSEVNLRSFVAHEVFHTWAGRKSHFKDSLRYPWLHEGMAEIFGLAFAFDGFENASEKIVHKIQACSDSLGSKHRIGLRLDYAQGRLPYNCGFAFQWYFLEGLGIDLSEFSAADYAKLVSEQILSGAEYGPEQFFLFLESKLPHVSLVNLRGFTNLPAPDNIGALAVYVTILRAPKVALGQPNADPDRVWRYTMWHVVSEICPKGWRGFGTEPERYLWLDIDSKICDSEFAGKKLTTLNGLSFFADRKSIIKEIIIACRNKSTLIFESLNSPEKYSMKCQNPVPPLPPLFQWRD